MFIDDLNRAFGWAIEKIDKTKGQTYNIGGGPANTVSVLELVSMLEKFSDGNINSTFSDWRPGDQKVYISDIRKARRDFGWKPAVCFQEGLGYLIDWLRKNKNLF